MLQDPNASAKLDLQASFEWLELLHGESLDGLVNFVAIEGSNVSSRFCYPTELETASDWLNYHNRPGVGIYARVTTMSQVPAKGRGGPEFSKSLPGFWCDMDLAGPGHKPPQGKLLPPDLETCQKIIDAAKLPQPSLWIHSGGGLYPWWMFNKPLIFTSSQDVTDVTALSKRWHEAISEGAKLLGYHVAPTTYNLDRVLRLPGTYNRKEGLERPCLQVPDLFGAWHSAAALVDVLDSEALRAPEPPRPNIPAPRASSEPSDGLSPLDDFEARTSWEDILCPHGWEVASITRSEWKWTRPGKERGAISATTGRANDRDRLYVFSDATDFEPNTPITKGYAYAVLNHGGDVSAAASELRRQGFGTQRTLERPSSPWDGLVSAAQPGRAQSFPDSPISTPPVVGPRMYEQNDGGLGQRLVDHYGGVISFTHGSGKNGEWMCFDENKNKWINGSAIDCVRAKLRATMEWAQREEVALYSDVAPAANKPSPQDKFLDYISRSKNARTLNSALTLAATQPEIKHDEDEFDSQLELFNTGILTINTSTLDVIRSVPGHYVTKVAGVAYDPQATAPRWRRFLEENLPDPEVRKMLQQAVGYALTGKANQKALFYLYGEANTGKSLFLEILGEMFGDYSHTLSEGALNAGDQREGGNATPHLAGLRGKRFVTMSESRSGQIMDDSLIKKVTGGDKINARELYRNGVTFTPQCVIFIASNHNLRVTGGDTAVWSRIKVVEFPVQFEVGDPRRDDNLKLKLRKELAGILNWALEGLIEFNTTGSLAYPKTIVEATTAVAYAQDKVQQFYDQMTGEAKMTTGVAGAKTLSSEVYKAYQNWHLNQEGDTRGCLGTVAFHERLGRIVGGGPKRMHPGNYFYVDMIFSRYPGT